MMSVQSGYAYYAICTTGTQFGQVVEGYEPIFEETSLVADTFDSFLENLCVSGNLSANDPLDEMELIARLSP